MAKDVAPLELRNFTKQYDSFRAVDNISLELKRGEVFGFLGPNGAGKSTTIRSIMNFMQPSYGSILINGKDSVDNSVDNMQQIGYLAGDIALYDNMTGKQLINYLSGLGKKTSKKRIDELVTKLEATLDRKIGDLSKGNKQKIGLIQAFMHSPELLILDEPTSGLDPLMKQVFYDLVLEAKKDGKTVFVSSHDLSEVQKICDRAAFIRNGELISVEDIHSAMNIEFKRFLVKFTKKPPLKEFTKLKNIEAKNHDDNQIEFTLTGNLSGFMSAVAKHNPIDLNEIDATLEDVFMHYYERKS